MPLHRRALALIIVLGVMRVPGPFRLQAVFRRDVPLADDVPILDSPSLDDLTVVYQLPFGRRISSFRSD